MPVLKFLADTNVVSDYFRPDNPVKAWFAAHKSEIGISTLTLAEIPRSFLRFFAFFCGHKFPALASLR